MRWNCPHCGINLAVSDDKLGNGWSFSRCYKCAGFALVRRSDVNLIKVDRAPVGEQVLLPEAHEEPTALLSQNAANNLARYINNGGTKAPLEAPVAAITPSNVERPQIRTATRRSAPPIAPQQPLQAPVFQNALPSPLPDDPATDFRQRMLPVAIGLTGLMAIGSGVFLYVQGQALFAKARVQATEAVSPASSLIKSNELTAAPTAGSAAAVAESNEIIQAPNLSGTTSLAAANAMARLAAGTGAEVSDQVHSNAMAPAREIPAETERAPVSKLQVLIKEAHIHSGPGMEFPIVGNVGADRSYTIEDSKDRWFKIILQDPEGKVGAAKKTAWIRNDLVRLVR